MKAVRVKVPSLDEAVADECIRQWLLQQKKITNYKPRATKLSNMFMQVVHKDILQKSYHDIHNLKKRKNFGTTSKSPAESSPASIIKLKRARYAQKKTG